MARHIFQIVLGRNGERTLDRPIKSDAHSRAADEREKSRAYLTVHVDDQIVFRAANLFEQFEKCHQRTPSAAALRKIPAGKKNDIGQRWMAADDLRVLRGDQPVNPRMRITCAQLHKQRNSVDDVAQGRRFDQQNARELCGLQSRRIRLLYLCFFDLAVQLPKLNQMRHAGQPSGAVIFEAALSRLLLACERPAEFFHPR